MSDTIKHILGFVLFATMFFCIGYGAHISTVHTDGRVATAGEARMEAQGEGSPVKYRYTVSDKARGYVWGVETKTFEDYQRAVGTKPDGKAGYDTCTATNFYNAPSITIGD